MHLDHRHPRAQDPGKLGDRDRRGQRSRRTSTGGRTGGQASRSPQPRSLAPTSVAGSSRDRWAPSSCRAHSCNSCTCTFRPRHLTLWMPDSSWQPTDPAPRASNRFTRVEVVNERHLTWFRGNRSEVGPFASQPRRAVPRTRGELPSCGRPSRVTAQAPPNLPTSWLCLRERASRTNPASPVTMSGRRAESALAAPREVGHGDARDELRGRAHRHILTPSSSADARL